MVQQHQKDCLSVQVIVGNDNFLLYPSISFHRLKAYVEWQIILLNVFAPLVFETTFLLP